MRLKIKANWRTGDISKHTAANLVAYGLQGPDWISPARWAAIKRHVSREMLND